MHHVCQCDPCRCHRSGADRSNAQSASAHAKRAASRRRRCSGAGEIAEPPVGAHLVTPRYGYTRHGIYAGGGIVIHCSGLSRGFSSGPVEEVTVARFANGRSVAIRCRGPMPFGEPEVVRRARSGLGALRYRLLSNNCEHFSEWAQFGMNRSTQVDRWFRSPRLTATNIARRTRVVLGSLLDRLLVNHEGVANPG